MADGAPDDVGEWVQLLAQWIGAHGYARVALQLGDELLPRAAALYCAASAALPHVQLCVLADTAYGACCVDVVAAQHVAAQAVVHVGPACLSAPPALPVLYIVPRAHADVDALVARHHSTHTVLLAAELQHLRPALAARYPAARLPALTLSYTRPEDARGYFGLAQPPAVPLLYLTPAPATDPLAALLALQLARTEGDVLVNGVPAAPDAAFVRKRRVVIERARAARAIAVVMGTLSIAQHVEAARRCVTLVRAQRKTAYTLCVGKVTLEKLLNFASNDVAVFVLIGCPYATLELSRALADASPVAALLTPHELVLSTRPDTQWRPGFDWRLDAPESDGSDTDSDDDDDHVHHSLLTGTISERPRAAASVASTTGDGQLVAAASGAMTLAAAVLARPQRWAGVDPRADGPVEAAAEGRRGLAAGYANEQLVPLAVLRPRAAASPTTAPVPAPAPAAEPEAETEAAVEAVLGELF